MAIVIKGAPAPGWYLPVNSGTLISNVGFKTPRLWTGVTRFMGRDIQGLVISIFKYEGGPRAMPSWMSATSIRGLRRSPGFYEFTTDLPETWRDQNIAEAGRKALQIAEEQRALIEQQAVRDAKH